MTQKTLGDYESTGHECEVCGRLFDTEGGKNKHHGAKHGSSKVGVECEYCGDVKEVYPSIADRTRFCGEECKERWESENWAGKDAPAWEGKTEQVECDWCDTEFGVSQSEIEHGRGRFCSVDCRASWQETQVGPKHPLWRGGKGLTDALRKSLGGWYTAKDKARQETCEWCGDDESGTGKSFDIHHIIPVNAGGVNHEDNLLCLCRTCHGKIEAFTRDIPEVTPIEELVE